MRYTPALDMVDERRPYLSLRHADFRRLWMGQFVSLIGTQMQVVAINWHIYLLTRSPLALGFVGLTRALPIIIFSLWGGIVADRRDRRRVMIRTQIAMTLVAAGLAVLTFTRHETVWLIYTLNALSAAASAFDAPARQSLIPRLVPDEDLPGALSLNLTAFTSAMIGGPALAGLLLAGGASFMPTETIDTTRLASIYSLNALSFLAVLFALFRMRAAAGKPASGNEAEEHPLRSLAVGLRFVFTTPLMVWTMALDFFATFFAGAMSLLPIFADQILKVGPAGYGLLVAAPALGALAGSLVTSLRPLPRKQGHVLLWSVAAYGFATMIFGFSRSYVLTLIALAGTGLADIVSTVVRQTLRQLITPDSLRGRMTSVNMIFFMGGPQLGEMEAGLVASLFSTVAVGATVSVVSGGLATLLTVAVVATMSPALRVYDMDKHLGGS